MREENGPMVSVLCMCYNHAPFIAQALQGFVEQQFNGPMEVIVHDDASTDGSADIIRDYQARYPGLVRGIYQTENQYRLEKGRVTRILYGAARGKYIALCEGDDYWTDSLKLQKQVDALEADPTLSMVFHNVWVQHEQSRYDWFLNHGIKKDSFALADILAMEWFVGTCSMVFRVPRDYMSSIREFSWSRSGDMVLQFHLGLEGDFLYLDEVMGVYRRHEGGVSHEIWMGSKHHYEQFLPAQVWLLWRFRDKVSTMEARNALDARMHGLLVKMVRYLMDRATDRNGLAMGTLRRSLVQLLAESKPPGEPEGTLGGDSMLKARLDTAVSMSWSVGIGPLLQRKGKQLGLWSCWKLISGAILEERYPAGSGIKLMLRCVRWRLAAAYKEQ